MSFVQTAQSFMSGKVSILQSDPNQELGLVQIKLITPEGSMLVNTTEKNFSQLAQSWLEYQGYLVVAPPEPDSKLT